MSYDLSVAMLLLNDWSVTKVDLSMYSNLFPSNTKIMSAEDKDRPYNQEYLGYNLCRFGDVSWKRDVVAQHVSISKGGSNTTERKKQTGFKYRKKRRDSIASTTSSLVSLAPVPAQNFKETLRLDDGEQNERWILQAMETSPDVVAFSVREESATPVWDHGGPTLCFANFKDKTFRTQE